MILSFRNEGTEDIYNGDNTKAARRTCPQSLWKIATRKLDQLISQPRLKSYAFRPAINWKRSRPIAEVNTAFESTSNIGFVLSGPTLALSKSR